MNQDLEMGSLSDLEAEVLSEGREWMRRRLEEKLQQRAEQISAHFSPARAAVGAAAQTKAYPAKRRRQNRR